MILKRLTLEALENSSSLREVLGTRQALIEFFVYNNQYNTATGQWQNYFYQFNYAAVASTGR